MSGKDPLLIYVTPDGITTFFKFVHPIKLYIIFFKLDGNVISFNDVQFIKTLESNSSMLLFRVTLDKFVQL